MVTLGLLALFALRIGGSLLANDKPVSSQAIPQGFTSEYLFIETTDGTFSVLQNPQLRALGPRTYLVGSTITLDGVTDDELFNATTRWVCLDDVRRMGEVRSASKLTEIKEIAERRRAIQEQIAVRRLANEKD